MSKIIDVAAIHFNVSERGDQERDEAFRQFREAEKRLDGTGVDLVVTCEGMSSLGQTADQAESFEEPGELLSMYRDFSLRNRCTTAGAVKLRIADKIFNALAFIGPDGAFLGHYAKAYPTPRELENGISPGPGAVVVDTPAGRLGGMICYDLNFDALAEQYRALLPDILCFSSMFHGDHLQTSRAYCARSFFVGAVKDACSSVVDPLGRELSESCYYNRIARARINLDRFIMHQDENIEKFPDIRRKYGKEILIDTNSRLGVSLLYSCVPDRTAEEVAREFRLVPLDDLLNRSAELAGK